MTRRRVRLPCTHNPARSHPRAVRAMAEAGIDLRASGSGPEEERLAVLRRVPDEIRTRLRDWLAGLA